MRLPLAVELCAGIGIVIAVASLPVSAQVRETPEWCTDDGTGSVQLPSGVRCNFCPPGTYVTQDCTADNPNPRCAPCAANRFYNPCYNYDLRCRSCSDCTPINADGRDGVVEGEDCTPTRDRVCRCPSNKYWDFKTAGCREKTLCAEGFGVARIATYKVDTACIECVDGTFSDQKSLTQQCQSCADCEGGTTLQPCTPTQNATCSWFGPAVLYTRSTIASVSAHTRSAPHVLIPVSTTSIEAIIGGSVGGSLLFALFLGCLWWRCRRRKNPDDTDANTRARGRPIQHDYADIEMEHRQEPPRTPEVSSRPATPPSTPNPASWTFPKKISDDGCCRPLMDTQDPGPPNNAHDVYHKEANPHPLQPLSLPPGDSEVPSGGRMEPVGSSNNDVSFSSPVQNV